MRARSKRSVSIIQSNYIPWKGYFDIVSRSDHFILLDDVQFTKQDWRNRNKIKTPQGTKWLTVPIVRCFPQKICDTKISNPRWGQTHWKTIKQNYGKAPCFEQYRDLFEGLYSEPKSDSVSEINRAFIDAICNILKIDTPITFSMDYDLSAEDPTDRLVQLCQAEKAETYISGPAARNYLEQAKFRDAGIDVVFFDYDGYPEYEQLYPPFDHRVSIIDMIFTCGDRTMDFIRRREVELL